MRQYFLTKATAERNLEIRRRLRRAKIEKENDIIISDNSFVHCDFQWDHKQYWKGKRIVWYNTLLISTKQLEEELKNIQNEKKQRIHGKGL
jgi:hypothetical protein